MANITRDDTAAWLRAATGLTQAEFASALGVTRTTVTRWENGSVPMPKWLWFAVKGMRFTHNGETGCYCRTCRLLRVAAQLPVTSAALAELEWAD